MPTGCSQEPCSSWANIVTEAAPTWVRQRERGNVLALRTMQTLGRMLPPRAADPLLWLVSLYFTINPTREAAEGSERYLRAVLGRRPGFAERHRHVRTFSSVVFERVALLGEGADRFAIRPRGHEMIARLHAERRGAVLLGAHYGSFEALRAFDRELPGLSVRYMMYEDNAETSTRVLGSVNPEIAERVIPLRDGIGAMMLAREALQAGHLVAFLGDRMPVRNPRAEVEVTFLGRPIRVPRAPYLSALMSGVPLILCFAPRIGRRTYEIEFTELHDGSPVSRGEREETCARLAQRYADALADMCRRHPYNWFNFFDIWS